MLRGWLNVFVVKSQEFFFSFVERMGSHREGKQVSFVFALHGFASFTHRSLRLTKAANTGARPLFRSPLAWSYHPGQTEQNTSAPAGVPFAGFLRKVSNHKKKRKTKRTVNVTLPCCQLTDKTDDHHWADGSWRRMISKGCCCCWCCRCLSGETFPYFCDPQQQRDACVFSFQLRRSAATSPKHLTLGRNTHTIRNTQTHTHCWREEDRRMGNDQNPGGFCGKDFFFYASRCPKTIKNCNKSNRKRWWHTVLDTTLGHCESVANNRSNRCDKRPWPIYSFWGGGNKNTRPTCCLAAGDKLSKPKL